MCQALGIFKLQKTLSNMGDTEEDFKKMWQLALPYLKQGIVKDFVAHTKNVVKAMELILEKERGDKDILIPAAILHDVGWSKVPAELQKNTDEDDRIEALKLHIKYALPIIEEMLKGINYGKERIERIKEIVFAHKFQDPKDFDKQLLIDADTLSDVFREQFYSDAKEYGKTPKEMYEFRKKNKFYTKTARKIFEKELGKRKKEL